MVDDTTKAPKKNMLQDKRTTDRLLDSQRQAKFIMVTKYVPTFMSRVPIGSDKEFY